MATDGFFNVTQVLLFQNSYFVDPTEEECLKLESADQLKYFELDEIRTMLIKIC